MRPRHRITRRSDRISAPETLLPKEEKAEFATANICWGPIRGMKGGMDAGMECDLPRAGARTLSKKGGGIGNIGGFFFSH